MNKKQLGIVFAGVSLFSAEALSEIDKFNLVPSAVDEPHNHIEKQENSFLTGVVSNNLSEFSEIGIDESYHPFLQWSHPAFNPVIFGPEHYEWGIDVLPTQVSIS
jgi:hypothetical protein